MAVNRNTLFKKLLAVKAKIIKDKSFNYMADFKRGKIVAAIKLELIDNALGLLINEFENNIDSMGVDLNCRSIIEAYALMKYLQDKGVKEEVAANFCLYNQHRILSFKLNLLSENHFFDAFEINEIQKIADESKESIKKEISELKESYKEKLSIDDEEVNRILSLKEPLLDGRHTFSGITKKYLTEEYFSLRKFFSFGVHPFFFRQVDVDLRNGMKQRLITKVLELAEEIVNEYDVSTDNFPSYQQFKKDKDEYIKCINKLCELINNSKKGFGIDGYYRCYVSQRKATFKDCALMALFGIGLQVQSKYKILIELLVMHENLTESMFDKDNYERFAKLFKANSYYNFSKIINEHVLYSAPDLNRISINLQEDIDQFINEALEVVKGITAEELKEGFSMNSLFLINFNKDQTIIDTIDYMIGHFIDGKKMGNFLKSIYRMSASIDHPSGLVFDPDSEIYVDYSTLQLSFLSFLHESSIFGLSDVFMPQNKDFLYQQLCKFIEPSKKIVMQVAQRVIDSHPNYSFDINHYSKIHSDIESSVKETFAETA